MANGGSVAGMDGWAGEVSVWSGERQGWLQGWCMGKGGECGCLCAHGACRGCSRGAHCNALPRMVSFWCTHYSALPRMVAPPFSFFGMVAQGYDAIFKISEMVAR